MTASDFFEVDFRFIVDKGQGDFDVIFPGTYGEYKTYRSLANLQAIEAYPNIWQEADILAKSAYSTILTDLGQVNAPSNLLVDPDTLKYFTSNFGQARHNIANAYPGPADQQYGTLSTGPLGTTPSVLSTKYFCQVPQRKQAGSLFVSILVADLVFLQVLWVVWILIVDGLFMRKHPERNHCEGCYAAPERVPSYRAVDPQFAEFSKETHADIEMDDGLRPTYRGRRSGSGSHERSLSQQRLIGNSVDFGNRRYES